jgi:hypothetical protein
MYKTLCVLAFVALAFGASSTLTQDDGVESAASVANFRCKVNKLDVQQDQRPENVGDALEPQNIRSHLGDVTTLEWAQIGQHFFSDIDGRSEEKILGTPGGDIAEFILALDVYQEESKSTVDQATATGLLMQYVTTMSRVKFYMSTSEHAHENVTSSSGCRNLDISDPPEDKKAELMELIVKPENVGCRHLKFMLQQPANYQTKAESVQMGIRAFHQVMWNKTFAGHTKLCYILLKGAHKEKAFVNVEVAQHCQDQGFAPLISPQTCYNSMYVNHPMAVIKFRAELAHFLAQKNSALAQAMIVKMNDKGTVQLAKTASAVLKGYPVFTVKLEMEA